MSIYTGITGPSSYGSVMTAVAEHWLIGDALLGIPKHIKIGLADKSEITQAIFEGWRTTLQNQQNAVQTALTAAQIARGKVNVMKAALLEKFGMFTTLLDGYYKGSGYDEVRPYAPTFNDGKENFLRPLGAMMNLWAEINGDVAPAGVTLPLTLGDDTEQGTFASSLSALIFAFSLMERKEMTLAVARAKRNVTQGKAYETMRQYREVAPDKYKLHPEMIESLPRLTPLPGHTPARVNASAMFEAPNQSKIVHDGSTDAMISHYELRGNAGDNYNEEDAVVIASHEPGEPMEFVTPFALTQPGAKAAFKVFVVLTTGNEAGSAEMIVERPVAVPLAA